MSSNLNPIISSIRNIASIPDLRRRVLFMLLMVVLVLVSQRLQGRWYMVVQLHHKIFNFLPPVQPVRF